MLAYPLLRDALAYNSVQEGMEAVARQFNGLAELLSRPDAGAALLARYKRAGRDVPASATPLAAGDHSYAVWAIESLLAQPQVIAGMSDKQLDASLKVASAKYAEKQADAAVYGPAGLEPTAVLLGRTLATREGWNWRRSALLRDAIAPSGKDVSAVLPAVHEALRRAGPGAPDRRRHQHAGPRQHGLHAERHRGLGDHRDHRTELGADHVEQQLGGEQLPVGQPGDQLLPQVQLPLLRLVQPRPRRTTAG